MSKNSFSKPTLARLKVEYRQTPLGIDVARPRFNWQMVSQNQCRGQCQTAYKIIVKDEMGETKWNSGKISSAESLHIIYRGSPLTHSTTYFWFLSVWDQEHQIAEAESWFETGLMNGDISAWDGAQWIGGGDDDLPLYADYLPLYNLSVDIRIEEGSERASIIFAANDPRLANKYKNIYQLQNGRNQSYFKVEIDVAEVDRHGGAARLKFYRAGYSTADDPTKPLLQYKIKPSVINYSNKFQFHHLLIHNEYGSLTVQLDNQHAFYLDEPTQPDFDPRFPPLKHLIAGAKASLNPAGKDHRVITYGMLNQIGFAVDAGQHARYKNLQVNNIHTPQNTLFNEDLESPHNSIFFHQQDEATFSIKSGCYLLAGEQGGVRILADPSRNSMPMLRCDFVLKTQPVIKARLYVTARGIYEFYMNGRRISNDYYNPGLTQYNRTHLYQTYDVSPFLKKGDNAMGAQLAEGWWSGMLGFGNTWNGFGDRQSLLAKLVVNYQDGSQDVIVTNNKNWQLFTRGPVTYGSLVQGEVYDVRKEQSITGWSEPGFDSKSWRPANVVELKGSASEGTHPNLKDKAQYLDYSQLQLVGQIGEPASQFKEVIAERVYETRPGVFIYDLGQNIVGVPRVEFAQGKNGQIVTLRYAEMLYPDRADSGANAGMILTENYRAALSQDIYIMRNGEQIYQPRFTSHGFQYIEISGIDEALPLEAVRGIAISSIREVTASYKSSSSALNKLWSNIVWSNIDNFLSVPTDCPQRNERMGWSGDISVFSRTAAYISNCSQFFRKHLQSMRDTQAADGRYADIAPIDGGFGGILWGCAGITLPWEAYWQYNDLGVLEENYTAMSAYLAYIETTIDSNTGFSHDQELGDWLGLQNQQLGAAFPATAYHIYALDIVSKVASLLGKEDEARDLRTRYITRKTFFNDTFASTADKQSSCAIGLALGAFNTENVAGIAEKLNSSVKRKNTDDNGVLRNEYSLMTGFIGTAWIGDALSEHGYSDTAYKLFLNEIYPSLLYSVRQGASTIWERLNGYTTEHGFAGNNSMNSFNHYSFGAVGQWLIGYSAGIQRDTPGYKTFILKPQIDSAGGITEVQAHYHSLYGKIESHWSIADITLHYQATVPANTKATLYLPADSIAAITESGVSLTDSSGITNIEENAGMVSMQLQSGNYRFVSELPIN